jgi:hypothetical protein
MQRETVIPNGAIAMAAAANVTLNPANGGMGGGNNTTAAAAAAAASAVLAMQADVADLKLRLAARERHVQQEQ